MIITVLKIFSIPQSMFINSREVTYAATADDFSSGSGSSFTSLRHAQDYEG